MLGSEADANQMRNIGGSKDISFSTNLPANVSLAKADRAVQFQASFISYLDVFRMRWILALVVWPIALF